jgi:hypothetical protein
MREGLRPGETGGERPSRIDVTASWIRQDSFLRLNASARSLLAAHPALYWTVVPAYRRLQRVRGRAALLASGTPRDALLDIYREVRVAPRAVRGACHGVFSALGNRGPGWVLDGDWDLTTTPFAEDHRYRAIRDVMTRGRAWSETDSYRDTLAAIDEGAVMWYCRTREQYEERCRAIEALYRDIEANGYLTQRELRERRGLGALVGRGDEVSVGVGRHGELLFVDGAHRLAIAQLLDLPPIPVEVRVRHAEWMAVRLEVAAYCSGHGGLAPQPVPHPDLDDVPARPGWDAAYALVAPHLEACQAPAIDVEARWGYLCQRMEASGVECVAVERDARHRTLLTVFKRAREAVFPVLPELAASRLPERARQGAVLLALTAEHRAHDEASVRRLREAVRELAPRELYINSRAALPASFGGGVFTSCTALGHASGLDGIYRLSRG